MLPQANDQIMELYQFLPNTLFSDHQHKGPEFIYFLEGFEFLTVYTTGPKYV